MKIDYRYSNDFYAMNAPELKHTCMHLLCTAGEGSFVFNERCYHIVANDLVVIPYPERISNLAAHPDMQVEWFAADYKFLQNLLPSNNYSIGGSISLNQDPVIHLNDQQARRLLDDFHRLRERMDERNLQFCQTLYDYITKDTPNLKSNMDKPVYTANWAVTRKIGLTGTLLEFGFISHETDRTILQDEAALKVVCSSIGDSLEEYFKKI